MHLKVALSYCFQITADNKACRGAGLLNKSIQLIINKLNKLEMEHINTIKNDNYKFDTCENVNAVFGWNAIDDKFLLIIKNSDNKRMFELELASDKDNKIDVVTKMQVCFKRLEEAKLK